MLLWPLWAATYTIRVMTMPDNRSSHGIAFKLIFRVLLFCAVTGFLASAYIFFCSRRIALENLDQKLASLARSSARQIDGELRGVEDYSRALASTIGLFHPSPVQLGELLKARVEQIPGLYGLAAGFEPQVLTPDTLCMNAWREKGRVQLQTVDFARLNYFQREWYRSSRTGGGWTSPYINVAPDAAGNPVTIVSYGCPILDGEARFAGALCADLDLSILSKIAETARLSGDCYVCIVDRKTRRFIVHPEMELVRQGKTFLLPDDRADAQVREMAMNLMAGRESSGVVKDELTGELRRIYFLPLQRNDWSLGVIYDENEILRDINRLMAQTFLIALLSFCALSLLVYRSARRITRPLVMLDLASQNIACGRLNTGLPPITENTEVGRLCASVRTMAQGLIALVKGIKHSTVRLVSASTQIAATSARQEEAMNGFESEVSSVAAAVAEISASARELASTMQTVNQSAVEAAGQAGKGKDSLLALEGTMRTLNNATHSMAGKLELIRQSVENISGIVGAIAEVAEQTNLLSLNASIEAEKAGEYGKGFSVVAREIRRLSDKTSVATVEIGQVAAGMDTAVEAGVAELELFTEAVSRCASEAGAIGKGLGGVIAQVTGLSPSFLRVNDGMQAQAQGAAEISEAMRRLRTGAESAAESMNQLNSATEQLREAANLLREETARFQTE